MGIWFLVVVEWAAVVLAVVLAEYALERRIRR